MEHSDGYNKKEGNLRLLVLRSRGGGLKFGHTSPYQSLGKSVLRQEQDGKLHAFI